MRGEGEERSRRGGVREERNDAGRWCILLPCEFVATDYPPIRTGLEQLIVLPARLSVFLLSPAVLGLIHSKTFKSWYWSGQASTAFHIASQLGHLLFLLGSFCPRVVRSDHCIRLTSILRAGS